MHWSGHLKKCTVSRPKCICGQRSNMASQGYTHGCYFFLLQRYRSTRQSLVQNGVLRIQNSCQTQILKLCLEEIKTVFTKLESNQGSSARQSDVLTATPRILSNFEKPQAKQRFYTSSLLMFKDGRHS
jgi:hypothetical protein